jgi:AcrR family transcriptional regulator
VPRPRKHSDAQLVAAAARAIATCGPHALTLADVAGEAGVSAATLVQRFGSKRGLMLAVAGSGPEVMADAFAAARTRRRAPLPALEDVLAEMAAAVSDPEQVANHLAFLAIDLADPEFRAHAARFTEALRAGIDALLAEAVKRGELGLRPRRPVVDAIQAAYHGTLLMWAIERQGDPGETVRAQVRLILRPYRR